MGVVALKHLADLADKSRPLTEFFYYIANEIDSGHMFWSGCSSPLFGSYLVLALLILIWKY